MLLYQCKFPQCEINKGNLTLILINPKEQHVKELSITALQLFLFFYITQVFLHFRL